MPTRKRCRPGFTRDPWPCCGKEPTTEWGREKNTICPECRRHIVVGKDAEERARTAGAKEYRRVTEDTWPG